jgi:hypothetical protein
MTNHSLLINYADSDAESTAPCKYWCRLAVDGSDEKLTVAAAAKMVDDLYNRNPCVPAEDQEPVPDAEVTDIEDAGKVLNVDLCAQLKSGDYTTKIRVIKSHPDTPHTSVIVGPGTIKSTVPTEAVVTYTVDVETAESATLLYPVVTGDFEAVWTGISGPEIKRHCEELTWEGVTTGKLTITHPTKYDLATVEVPGVPKYEGSDRGDPQEFELLVFYNHQTYKEQFESPLDYDSISEVCGWYSSSVTVPEDPEDPYPEPPPDPEDPCQETVMDRYNTSYKPGTQPFDDDKCCGDLPVMNSDCMVMKVGTVQSKEMSPEVRAYYENLGDYCYAGLCTPVSAVEFVAVGPAPGETCGDIINETVVQQRNCCEDVLPITDIVYPEVIADYSYGYIGFFGGIPPFDVRLLSPGIYLDVARTKTYKKINYRGFYVYTEDVCGSLTAVVSDLCGNTITATMRATEGRWEVISAPPGMTCLGGEYINVVSHYWQKISGQYRHDQTINSEGRLKVEEYAYPYFDPPPPCTGICLPGVNIGNPGGVGLNCTGADSDDPCALKDYCRLVIQYFGSPPTAYKYCKYYTPCNSAFQWYRWVC